MKQLIARLKYYFTGKHDPMDLLNGVYENNLPKRLTISKGMLKSDMLAYEAADLVVTLYRTDGDDEFDFADKLRELPKHWGTLEALMYYDAMVSNGGHVQYFVNSDGAFLDLVEDGLMLFASDYHQNLFKRALHRYDSDRYSDYVTLDVNVPSEEENWRSPYDDLDSFYFKSEPTLPCMVEKFIRSNLKLFKG